MANPKKDKHGFWAKIPSELYKMASKEVKSKPGRINILMMVCLLAIILLYILVNTAATVARIFASCWNSAFVGQTGDNILPLLFVFLGASVLCLIFMRFIIKEEGENDKPKRDRSKEDDK